MNLEAKRAAGRIAQAKYRAAHPERVQAYLAGWRASHRDVRRIHKAAYRRAHPEKVRENNHRYRSRLRGQFIEAVDTQLIYERDRGRCHICGKHVKRADASMDHLKPISLGGVHAPWNVSLAHLECNLRRNAYGTAQLLLAF